LRTLVKFRLNFHCESERFEEVTNDLHRVRIADYYRHPLAAKRSFHNDAIVNPSAAEV
jgi:hypothetical protein